MTEITTIDQYLDALADALIASPRRARRILIEVQDHLYTTRETLVAEGMTPEVAEETTLHRFGSPALVAGSFRTGGGWLQLPFLEALATPLLSLASIGFIAIGLSGLLALGLGVLAGKQYVTGNEPGVVYTAERCQDFLGFHPEAADCASAAVAHHFDEVVDYRLAAGVLGLTGLLFYVVLQRLRRPARLPRAFTPTIGTAAFGLAGAGFTFVAAGQILTGADAVGANLSAGIVSLLFAAAYSLRLLPLLTPEVTD